MMDHHEFPRLRPVEVNPSQRHSGAFDVSDPSGIAVHVLTLSHATLFIAAMMDGRRRRSEIQAHFMRRYGKMLFSEELDQLIAQIDDALFLAGPRFEGHHRGIVDAYRRSRVRPMRDINGLGAPADELGGFLDALLGESDGRAGNGRIVGLVAPHLDYPRGRPCYSQAYAGIAESTAATRFVILGTNHFGMSTSVVGTRKDFDTPFGVVPHDAELMRRLDERCGVDLCEGEHDHVREHSIELQVMLLNRALGDRPFTIAPYLCPDPCGPTGTKPRDGCGVDLRDFAAALREEVAALDGEICVIAGADLSHVGRYFDHDCDLSGEALTAIESSDRAALSQVEKSDPEAFVQTVAATSNATNICSVGCIYALAKALEGRAQPRLLHYHQALTREIDNCVTCAAMAFLA